MEGSNLIPPQEAESLLVAMLTGKQTLKTRTEDFIFFVQGKFSGNGSSGWNHVPVFQSFSLSVQSASVHVAALRSETRLPADEKENEPQNVNMCERQTSNMLTFTSYLITERSR